MEVQQKSVACRNALSTQKPIRASVSTEGHVTYTTVVLILKRTSAINVNN